MKKNNKVEIVQDPTVVIRPDELLEYWQGHRRLTHRLIETFPESKLFYYSLGGKRSFSALVMDLIKIGAPSIYGLASGKWKDLEVLTGKSYNTAPKTKEEILRLWDWSTETINNYWPLISPRQFRETGGSGPPYEDIGWARVFYCIDKEIHYQGQGYIYLRALGIEPHTCPETGSLELPVSDESKQSIN